MDRVRFLKRISVLAEAINILQKLWGRISRVFFSRRGSAFPGSDKYWRRRYESGGNSGDGSYNLLAKFKADVVNALVKEEGVREVIEFGCGDGNQLALADYPRYIGFDVSPVAVRMCAEKFSADATKEFKSLGDYKGEKADLAISLDVVFHLVEDAVYMDYMRRLFQSARRLVVVYSSNTNDNPAGTAQHVRHRKFTDWVEENATDWVLDNFVRNRYPFNGDNRSSSFCDFYIYRKI